MPCSNCDCWDCTELYNPSPELKENEHYYCVGCGHDSLCHYYYGCEVENCGCDGGADTIIATEETKIELIREYLRAKRWAE